MTAQSSRYTASGDLSVYAGEALAIELMILRDGAPIDPTGREGALTLWRTTNRVPILPSIAGETVDGTDATHGAVKLLRYVLPGSATDLVFTKHRTDCGYQIASANADGLDFRLIGKVLPKASASLGAVTGPGEPPVVALSLETRTQRILVDARGAPGLSPWEALGITQAEYEAGVRQPAVDAAEVVGDAITELGEFTSERSAEIDAALVQVSDAGANAVVAAETALGAAGLISEQIGRVDDLALSSDLLAPLNLLELGADALTLGGERIALGAPAPAYLTALTLGGELIALEADLISLGA